MSTPMGTSDATSVIVLSSALASLSVIAWPLALPRAARGSRARAEATSLPRSCVPRHASCREGGRGREGKRERGRKGKRERRRKRERGWKKGGEGERERGKVRVGKSYHGNKALIRVDIVALHSAVRISPLDSTIHA